MLFVPILTAIQTMLSADASTKDLIKAYRQFTPPEPGTWDTPLCVLGPDLDIEPNLSGYGPTILRNKKVDLTIHLLERSYDDVQDHHKATVIALDTLQHNACAVFEADPTLSASVANSKITRLQLQRYDEEYFEFIITLTVDTKLE
jgi:hypothetical protein